MFLQEKGGTSPPSLSSLRDIFTHIDQMLDDPVHADRDGNQNENAGSPIQRFVPSALLGGMHGVRRKQDENQSDK